MSAAPSARTSVQVTGKVVSVKRAGAFHHLTLVAPGVAERFRPGSFLTLAVGGDDGAMLMRRAFAIYRARPSGAYAGTVEVVFPGGERGRDALTRMPAGSAVDVVGPLGRPFALPKEPVTCTLVGEGHGSAVLFGLAARLRERGCAVHMLFGGATEAGLFGVLEARRAAQSVQVATGDGSVGSRGRSTDLLAETLRRTGTDVVYAAGPFDALHTVAAVAEQHGAWSQTAVDLPMPCGTGVCMGCVLPVVGEDGVTKMARSCLEGPVFRGDRVRWDDVGTVPADAWGATRAGVPG